MLVILGKFHTLARSGGFSPKLATYELCELDEYRRVRQQRELSVSDEDLMDQLKDYERDVSACEALVCIVVNGVGTLHKLISLSSGSKFFPARPVLV